MNQCFETESGQSESVSITAIEGLSITKESFEKANDEPNNKHENILSKLYRNAIDKELSPSENEFETILYFVIEQNEVTIDLTIDY